MTRASKPASPPKPAELCCRCGRPAEGPVVVLGGQPRGRVPLCLGCLALLLAGPQTSRAPDQEGPR
jgi:hypothetical protein